MPTDDYLLAYICFSVPAIAFLVTLVVTQRKYIQETERKRRNSLKLDDLDRVMQAFPNLFPIDDGGASSDTAADAVLQSVSAVVLMDPRSDKDELREAVGFAVKTLMMSGQYPAHVIGSFLGLIRSFTIFVNTEDGKPPEEREKTWSSFLTRVAERRARI